MQLCNHISSHTSHWRCALCLMLGVTVRPAADWPLPGAQLELFKAIMALGKPVVVFIMNAGPVDISYIKESGVPIVSAGYGGEFGGQATADVLTGAFNPGGALTYTVYPQEFTQKSSFRDMTMRSDKCTVCCACSVLVFTKAGAEMMD
eukprot:m.1101706 g.1101706  ORF g.1101706 m.1101706 type:complete len:148 (-) comp24326_c0_seq10:775-1218(-)